MNELFTSNNRKLSPLGESIVRELLEKAERECVRGLDREYEPYTSLDIENELRRFITGMDNFIEEYLMERFPDEPDEDEMLEEFSAYNEDSINKLLEEF